MENIIEKLKNAKELDLDTYDGSYELMRETIEAYSHVQDFSIIDYKDLNLVYHMSLGTWKHSIDKKKESVSASHLQETDKNALNSILDTVWQRAQKGEYENMDGEGGSPSVGMFGTGFYSFVNKTNNESAQAFIKMCVDIKDMTDDTEIYDRAEDVLVEGFKGMGAAAASQVLHCLKPQTFPIFNSNMGYQNIFEALGVDLSRKSDVSTYIDNCRKVKEYRDSNFSFKNYRIFDMAAWDLEQPEKTMPEIDCIGLLEYLDENAGKSYMNPDKAPEDKKDEILETKARGQNAIKILKSIGDACSKEYGPFKIDGGNWLDASYTKVRSYLWAQLKYEELVDSPESISIFVEQDENSNEARFRISLEIKDTNAKPNDYERHYKSLELPLNVDGGLQYFLGGNNSDVEFGASDITDPVIIKQMLDNKEIQKVQISRCISRSEAASNEEMLNAILDAVEDIQPYYDHVMESAGKDKTYWPPLDEYDPGLSKDDYKRCISDPSIVKYDNIDTVYYIYQMGGEATCTQISAKYGGAPGHYNQNGQHVARWIADETNCPIYDKDGKNYWSVLFTGRNTEKSEEGVWIWKLREPLSEAIDELEQEGFFEDMKKEMLIDMNEQFDKNMILYGPPGTGKTYNSVIYAVAICDDRTISDVQTEDYADVLARYRELRSEGRIAFTTFHQSYGYEEFIEGIKPVTIEEEGEKGEIQYKVEDGIFKWFCNEKAAKAEVKSTSLDIRPDASIWKITIKNGSKNDVKDECFQEGNMRIGFDLDEDDTSVKEFVEDMMPGDIVLSFKTRESIDGIGIIGEGDVQELPDKEYFRVSRPVKWIATDIDENIININDGKKLHRPTVARVPRMAVEDILEVARNHTSSLTDTTVEKNTKPYVFIIDEINRGNISKIFGELITLIETTKRKGAAEAMSATLPYSQSSFSVPDNVYILGTMNTADRSIALMDTALRRRFDFIEMMPESSVLSSIGADTVIDGDETLDVAGMLDKINARIEYLFDREHTIGHAFFTGLKDDPTIDNLAGIFLKNVIPLLQEYFYEDYNKIQLVLGDNGKENEEYKFIRDTQIVLNDLFKGNPDLDLGETKYEINRQAFFKIQSYQEI